jgi:hypothetical protein
MTGPEHFKAAEELIAGVELYGADFTPEGRADQIAIAQVHATLAAAAAAALSTYGQMPIAEYRAWREACGEPEEAAPEGWA